MFEIVEHMMMSGHIVIMFDAHAHTCAHTHTKKKRRSRSCGYIKVVAPKNATTLRLLLMVGV